MENKMINWKSLDRVSDYKYLFFVKIFFGLQQWHLIIECQLRLITSKTTFELEKYWLTQNTVWFNKYKIII